MIFSIDDHIQQIIEGKKTQTRRPTDRYRVGQLYAIQPGRGKAGTPKGKIYIGQKIKEWKPDVSHLPKKSLARLWEEMEANYPIKYYNAEAEGGYTSEEYEEIYENMYPEWDIRWAYWFSFFTTEEIEACRN